MAHQEFSPLIIVSAEVESMINSLREIDTHLTAEQAAKHVFYGLAWSIADDVCRGLEVSQDRIARYRYLRQIVQGY